MPMVSLSSSPTLSANSSKLFSVEWMRASAWFLASTSSARLRSSSAWDSASFTICSISSSESPPEAWMRIECSLPVALSCAATFTRPLASISKVTSIWGMPLGAGGIPTKLNWPSNLLSMAISRSPWNTRMVTASWLSSAVEKIWLFFVGIVVLRSIKRVKRPPLVSIPRDSGVTSRRRTSFTSPCRTPPWIAAPIATTSSGFTPLLGSLPKKDFTVSVIFGIRVIPPTRTISSTSPAFRPASFRAFSIGAMVRFTKSSTRLSSLERVSFMVRCFGPDWSAVIKGRLISVCVAEESSIFAFSAASFRRWRASLSLRRSIEFSFLNSSAK